MLKVFEPNPITFNSIDEDEVAKVRKGIEKASGKTAARFRTPVNRRSFLAACLDFTSDESVEHLIVGYGIKFRTTTKVDSLHHVTGQEGSVAMTKEIEKLLNDRLFWKAKGEVLIFHNHPKWFLNAITDNLPIASSTDRTTASAMKLHPALFLKNLLGNGDVKFYLGENGFVQEFRIPPFDQLANIVAKLQFGNDKAVSAIL